MEGEHNRPPPQQQQQWSPRERDRFRLGSTSVRPSVRHSSVRQTARPSVRPSDRSRPRPSAHRPS